MKFSPGEKFNYNNQGFVYLAVIIEEVSKKSYNAFINEDVLKPIGIFHSGIYHGDHYPNNTALGYLDNEENSKMNKDLLPYQSGGDGGAIMSSKDMKHLWESFFEYKIISKELVEEFIKIQAIVDEESDNYYGLGVWLKKDKFGLYPYLLGGDPGISFTISYHPIDKKYMFAASNTTDGVWDIFNDLAK